MTVIDRDLLSVQEARILIETSVKAREELLNLNQKDLDFYIEEIGKGLLPLAKTLSEIAYKETDYGIPQDDEQVIEKILTKLPMQLGGITCKGHLEGTTPEGASKIGVPKGIIVCLAPPWFTSATVIHNVMLSIKTGNPIIVVPHPRAKSTTALVMDKICSILKENRFPLGGVDYLKNITEEGERVLTSHNEVALVIENNRTDTVRTAGRDWFKGEIGNNPVFVERTADLKKAALDIVNSKAFNNGLLPGVEQSIVAEKTIDIELRQELTECGARFLTKEEEDRLQEVLFSIKDSYRQELLGKSAIELAKRADIRTNVDTKVLIVEKPYVSRFSPYSVEKFAPILSYYVEDNWMNACEKCIELILNQQLGHSLSVYSKDEYVINQFSLKKPVSNIMINQSTGLAGTGLTSNVPLCFSIAKTGEGLNGESRLSCGDLINIRNVYRNYDETNVLPKSSEMDSGCEDETTKNKTEEISSVLMKAFLEALK